MISGLGGFSAFRQLLGEIKRSLDAGSTISALAMTYIGIDTMALLACPVGQIDQQKRDFIAWVDKYLRADAASPYQYQGVDVYAARCALLHSYGSTATSHRKSNPPKLFTYVDAGPHHYDAANGFVIISAATLLDDFAGAMQTFLAEYAADPNLKPRIETRLASLLITSLLPSS